MSPTETKVFPSASVARTTSDEPAGETNVAGGAGAAETGPRGRQGGQKGEAREEGGPDHSPGL